MHFFYLLKCYHRITYLLYYLGTPRLCRLAVGLLHYHMQSLARLSILRLVFFSPDPPLVKFSHGRPQDAISGDRLAISMTPAQIETTLAVCPVQVGLDGAADNIGRRIEAEIADIDTHLELWHFQAVTTGSREFALYTTGLHTTPENAGGPGTGKYERAGVAGFCKAGGWLFAWSV